MKYLANLMILIALTAIFLPYAKAGEVYSSVATQRCILYVEMAAYARGYSFVAHKIKGATYTNKGKRSEFIVSVEGKLAMIKCQLDDKAEIIFLQMDDIVIMDGR